MAQDFPTTGSPPMIGRKLSTAEWLDYVEGYDFGSLPPSRLVLHHTWRPTLAQWNGLATMRGMQRFYAGKGWGSAPHIYVGPDGIWLFTPMSRIGIHAGTGNGSLRAGWYSIGLEMVGNYDTVRPSGAVWEYSRVVMGSLSRRLNIPPRRLISFHRDYTGQKSCPGWAVTKDWVFGEVEAWLSNAPSPVPPPLGEIGTPAPDDEALLEAFLQESYARRGQGYNNGWAFHQFAVDNGLGMPLSPSATETMAGKSISYQVFARDTLFCEVPNWGDVQRLSELLAGSIPPDGLGRALLEATYRSGKATFRPDWAFHQYAMSAKLGPPIGESSQIRVDGREYAFQVFAIDTLYNLVPNWSDVQELGRLADASDPATVRLRDALLAETYKRAGAEYRPDWAFHQAARRLSLGVPLDNSRQINVGNAQYALQIYATDTLYNLVPNWSDVKRLKDLARAGGMPSFDLPMQLPDLSNQPPVTSEFVISSYNPPASAFAERNGARIDTIVLHALPGKVEDVLASMSALGSHFATHYYIGQNGRMFQLVDEQYAAWHAGFATVDGDWFNLNRVSIGIALERPAGWPNVVADSSEWQVLALRWLLINLARRYPLRADSVILWSSLAGSQDPAGVGLPIESIREVLPE